MMRNNPFQKTELLMFKLWLVQEPQRILLYWFLTMREQQVLREKDDAIIDSIEHFKFPLEE